VSTAFWLAGLLAWAPAPAAAPAPVPELASFIEHAASCPEGVAHCFGIVAHVVVGEAGPVENARWLAAQVEQANRLFAVLDVGFRVVEARAHDAEFSHVATREQRDAIGAERFTPGVVHLFVVQRLDDVDVDGEVIRGVHWRLRREPKKRWIILSTIAAPAVLAHELGHFFGLPHSAYAASIMNKKPREQPPVHRRGFVAREIERMKGFLTFMLFEGELVALE
jgi:hypothetical protein